MVYTDRRGGDRTMDENTRIGLLKKGGKKALAEYNRVTGPDMNLGTRVHADERYKKPKHKNRAFDTD